jgi:acylphosphatase
MNAGSNETRQELARLHIWVTGRVQGVGFRAFAQHTAHSLGLTGWVRNVGYNHVEMVAEGLPSSLERFADTVRTGPAGSRVDEYQMEWETALGEFFRFEVRSSR